ncbi:MAG: trypsin-like peptidase domain-containing protein [Bdellovibrionota bacterium]
MKKWITFGALILIVFMISLSSQLIAQPPPTFVKTPPAMKLGEPLPANLFVELAKIINPTVVNISTSAKARGSRFRDPMMDLFEQFYGIPMQEAQRQMQMSLGTGFIIREDGLIVTNNHVVQGADIINVQLSEKTAKTYEAKLVGSDLRTDIALIKISATQKLSAAALGNSNDLQVGEWVAAFGNPFGHGHSMTKGVISSKGRQIGEINKVPLLQTDASINPGNSGGPLVDTRGYVIGVNSAVDARAQGIGFAIPIDEVKKIIPDLESRGSIRQGYIGIHMGDMEPDAAAYLGLKEGSGAVIIALEKGAPAAKAGAKPYDVIIEFNGKKIKNTTDLADTISDSEIGKKVPMKVVRNRKTVTLDITVGERTSSTAKPLITAAPKTEGKKAPNDLGFSVADLDSDLRQNFGYSADVKRPIIVGIQNGSMAALAGLQVGDLVLDINKVEVTTAKEVLSQLKKGTNTLRLARGARVIVVTMTGP